MSETPRIVFTFFSAHTDSMVAAWQRFAADLLPDASRSHGKYPETVPAAERLNTLRSSAVRLPMMSRGGADRDLRHTSLRGAKMPTRRAAVVASDSIAPAGPSAGASESFSASVSALSTSLSLPTSSAPASSLPASSSSASALATSSLPAASRLAAPHALVSAGSSSAPLGGVWRLLATNNREIARSVRVYPSFPEARADVDRICAHPEDLVVAAVVGPDRGTRGWYASLEGEPVLTCSRWYETSSSSVAASADAIEALQHAVIVDAVRTIESADRRRSRTRATESSVVGW